MRGFAFASIALCFAGVGCGSGSTRAEPWGSTSESLCADGAKASVQTALGVPTDSDPSDDAVIDKGDFVLSYNDAKRDPNWVSWHLAKSDLGSSGRSGDFEEDPALPDGMPSAKSSDFTKSGYERGHLCPSADRTATTSDNQMTFFLTNILPQTAAMNIGPWEKLEDEERSLVEDEGKELYIVAGPIFGDEATIGADDVVVPTEMFKLIVIATAGAPTSSIDQDTQVIAVRMPNVDGIQKDPWTDYRTTIGDLQIATGYDFLSALPSEVQCALEGKASF